MRICTILAVLAVSFALMGANSNALAGTIPGRAGDIGRAIEKISLARVQQDGSGEAGLVEPAPLPTLRQAEAINPPLPSIRRGFQLASLENSYLAVLPPVIKPRVLDGDVSETVDQVEQPRPRFVTWTRERDDDVVVRGGRRQACFHCLLRRKSSKYGVPFRLARAVVEVESNYRRDAVGGVGEIGLMQIRPQTARWLGFGGEDEELFNPPKNLEYGVKYLGKAWQLGEGSLCRVILKYNAGHNAKRMNPMSKQYCAKVQSILRDDAGRVRLAAI